MHKTRAKNRRLGKRCWRSLALTLPGVNPHVDPHVGYLGKLLNRMESNRHRATCGHSSHTYTEYSTNPSRKIDRQSEGEWVWVSAWTGRSIRVTVIELDRAHHARAHSLSRLLCARRTAHAQISLHCRISRCAYTPPLLPGCTLVAPGSGWPSLVVNRIKRL